MSPTIDLACLVCTEEFMVPLAHLTDPARVVQCPCCGSTELVPLVFDEPAAQPGRRAAA
jgi:DNA-directed RNA polymerase subunit RPC12/RpoP